MKIVFFFLNENDNNNIQGTVNNIIWINFYTIYKRNNKMASREDECKKKFK